MRSSGFDTAARRSVIRARDGNLRRGVAHRLWRHAGL